MMIGRKLPCERRNIIGALAIQICKSSTMSNAKVAKSVVSLSLYLSSPPNDLVVAQDMAMELLKVIGSETTDPLKMSETYPVINQSTQIAIASALLQLIESIVADMDWNIRKLKTNLAAIQRGSNGEQAPGLALEETLYSRTEDVVKVLSSFTMMKLKG